MTVLNLCLCTSLIFVVFLVFGKNLPATELSMKDVKHFQVSIDRSIFGVLRLGSHVWTLPQRGEYFIQGEYDSAKKDSFDAFYMKDRSTALSSRIQFPDSEKNKGTWRGPLNFDRNLFFLDTDTFRYHIYDFDKKSFIKSGDLIVDRIKPAADSRGEPTQSETRMVRAKFIRAIKNYQLGNSIFADFSRLNNEVNHSLGYQGLVLSRIKGFPLAMISCRSSKGWFCELNRLCYASNRPELISDQLQGLAYDNKARRLLIALRNPPRIYVYKYKSCYDIRYLEEIKLPERLSTVTAIDIDDEGALWVALEEPDPYSSGSVFRWDKYIKK